MQIYNFFNAVPRNRGQSRIFRAVEQVARVRRVHAEPLLEGRDPRVPVRGELQRLGPDRDGKSPEWSVSIVE